MGNFDIVVKRGNENLKRSMTPEFILNKEIPTFAASEMDFPTAPSLINSVRQLVDNGLFGFTIMTSAYQEKISYWMKAARDFNIDKNWIVPTCGTIHSLATTIKTVTKEGQGVIIQSPGYSRYEQAITRLGRKTIVNTLIENNGAYTMDFAELENLMASSENHLFILCNPHNPTGRVWNERELSEIAKLAKKYSVTVFSDEIFAEITFDGHRAIPFIEISPDNSISCTSLGKCFNLTGVNQANVLIADSNLRDRFITQRNREHYGSIEPFAYAAIMGAYTPEGLEWKNNMLNVIDCNRKMLIKAFKNTDTNYLYPIEGTYVAWIKWSGLACEGKSLKSFLEEEALLSLDIGFEYGKNLEKYTRMNLASTNDQMKSAIERMKKIIN